MLPKKHAETMSVVVQVSASEVEILTDWSEIYRLVDSDRIIRFASRTITKIEFERPHAYASNGDFGPPDSEQENFLVLSLVSTDTIQLVFRHVVEMQFVESKDWAAAEVDRCVLVKLPDETVFFSDWGDVKEPRWGASCTWVRARSVELRVPKQ
jgi:hypothetical protein